MARCPNCGQNTKRTEDWACQWCGYPLLSGGYKKLDQSYREVKGESVVRAEPEEVEEETPEPPRSPVKAIRAPEPKRKPEPEPEPETEPEPPEEAQPEPLPAPRPVARVAEPLTTPEPPPPPPPPPVIEPLAPPRPNPIMSADVCPMVLDVTTEELSLAFESDRALANSKLANRVLKVTGIIDRIFLKEHLDIQYFILTTPTKAEAFNVRCTFDKKMAYQLRKLNPGERVVVQGKYGGAEKNIILKDCSLVSS